MAQNTVVATVNDKNTYLGSPSLVLAHQYLIVAMTLRCPYEINQLKKDLALRYIFHIKNAQQQQQQITTR